MSLRQVVAPVPDVEHQEGEGEDPPRKDVDLLGLELEVVDPRGEHITFPGVRPAVEEKEFKKSFKRSN